MSAYDVILLSEQLSPIGEYVSQFFEADVAGSIDELFGLLADKPYGALVYDIALPCGSDVDALDLCRDILQHEAMVSIPLLVVSASYSVEDKFKAFELGCDDLIAASVSLDEVCARVTKSIFNEIAHLQLNERLAAAHDTAKHAMDDNCDLTANIQCLLAMHDCDNLDQLGQQFFASIGRFGLSCSLQLRSELDIKDMEAHGMAKDLESQLLLQLKDKGRFIDFGPRTIVNYDRVSLLIKNMPIDEAEKYSMIRHSLFCLAKGLSARVIALENMHKLSMDKESHYRFSTSIQSLKFSVKDSYQKVMKQILVEIENAAQLIQSHLPSEASKDNKGKIDEAYICEISEHLVQEATTIFNDGLKIDIDVSSLNAAVESATELFETTDRYSGTAEVDILPERQDQNTRVQLY